MLIKSLGSIKGILKMDIPQQDALGTERLINYSCRSYISGRMTAPEEAPASCTVVSSQSAGHNF